MVAFVLLGIATAIGWIRRREKSFGWLALAIVVLAVVSLLSRLPALLHFTPPLLNELSLVGFMVSGYAVIRYRGSLIPLPSRWHAAAIVAMVAASGAYLAAKALGSSQVLAVAAIILPPPSATPLGAPTCLFSPVAPSPPPRLTWAPPTLPLPLSPSV